jgi:3',5'-cyclic AMP phosphodiesterase CpdA
LRRRGQRSYVRAIRLAITSDLHVDHHADAIPLLAEAVKRTEADVLVVAGDLTANGELLERSLASLRGSAREAVFVPGNHDLWCKADGASSKERYERIVPAHVRNAGFHAPFTEERVVLFGHRFVSVTGWYDYSLRDVELDHELLPEHYAEGRFGPLHWSDKLLVRWPEGERRLEDPEICDRQVASLKRQLAQPGAEPIVAVLHHLPFKELTTSSGMPWNFLNGFMGSARLGDLLMADRRVRLSISGHTHFHKDVQIVRGDRTLRAVVSPLGYPREYRRAGFTLPEQVQRRVLVIDL